MVIKKIINSFAYAFEGVKAGSAQRNFRIHLIFASFAIFLSFYFHLSSVEWALIFLSIGGVLAAELLNSAIEEVCNIITDKLKLNYFDTWNARNLAAGGVYLMAIAAASIGAVIFLPRIINLFF